MSLTGVNFGLFKTAVYGCSTRLGSGVGNNRKGSFFLALSQLRAALPGWREDPDNRLTERFRRPLLRLWCDLMQLNRRIGELDTAIEAMAKSGPVARRLEQLRGVGPLIATALVAAVGSGGHFTEGRDLAVRRLVMTGDRQYSQSSGTIRDVPRRVM